MRDTLAAYPGLIRAATQVALTYRTRMALWLLGGLFPLLLLGVWLTVVAEGGPPAGWTSGDFLSYYAAATVMANLSGQHVVWEWDNDLRSGDLSARLLRPIHPFHQYAAADAGHRIVLLGLLLPMLVVAALIVPGIDYAAGPVRLVLVSAAVAVGYLLSLAMASAFALIGFWSTQTANLWMLWWGAGAFLSGWVAPVALMPDPLGTVASVLPFWPSMGFPVELSMGRLDAAEIVRGFAVGLGWLGVWAALYVIAWRRGIRRFQAVAG